MYKKTAKVISIILSSILIFQQSGFAQIVGQIDLSNYINQFRQTCVVDKFRPLHLRYLSYNNLNNSFKLLLDKGDLKDIKTPLIQETTQKLLDYFFVGISLPNSSFWVNLRPDAPDNIIDPYLAQTDVGRILLEADLQLKKDTAKFTSPENPKGKEYWDKLYKKASKLFGSDNITIPTITRPWIVPDEIIVCEASDNAYIYKATLKVKLEQDHLKESAVYNFDDPRLKELNEYSSQLIRELIIPVLTKEINTSKRYASLRQVYYSLILARWFKQKFNNRNGFYSSLIDKRNLNGLVSKNNWSKATYFEAYQKSFQNGEYTVKESINTSLGQAIRSYVSGGIDFGASQEGGGLIAESMQHALVQVTTSRDIFEGNPNNLPVDVIKGGTPENVSIDRGEIRMGESKEGFSSVPTPAVSMGQKYVVDFNDENARNEAIVGSKAANLKEAANITGIKIPRGFCVTTDLFDAYLASINIQDLFSELELLLENWEKSSRQPENRRKIEDDIVIISEKIKDRILTGTLTKAQSDAISDFYEQLSNNKKILVAVRSSAMAEDMPEASFAGQYETHLNQMGLDQVIEAIKKVWASTYNFNAIMYRNKNKILPEKVKMAVLIQEMINADSAGTAFSVDVETGAPMLTLSNTYGLGESDVAGIVSSDIWVIDPDTNAVLKRRKGEKKIKIISAGENGESRSVETAREEQNRFVINSKVAREIARQLKVIHDHFTEKIKSIKYIDAEYVISTSGDIIFTQVRPETVWGAEKLSLVAIDQRKAVGFDILLEGGITGSPGVVTGKIRVVRSPEEAKEKIKPGDIMVAPSTTSLWERSMELASAMVTEIGGPGNHTAVVAREQGKPAMVGNPEAIEILSQYENQEVTIDATLKKIYLGRIPEDCYFCPEQISVQYKGVDQVSEENAWQGAARAEQTIEDNDGSRWIGKPNEQTSLFLEDIHDKSHDWIADQIGLSRVEDRYENGIYQVRFSDIHKWREELRRRNIEELESIYQLWVDVIEQYLEASQNLSYSRQSMEHWIDSFIKLNGVMNIAFPFSEVVYGLREAALAERGIKEPYFTFAHSSLSGLFGKTLANESRQTRGRIVEELRKIGVGGRELLGGIANNDPLAIQRFESEYPALYNELKDYAGNYRITTEFALSLTSEWPLQMAARYIIDDYDHQATFIESRPLPEEFYPDDTLFTRISRMAALVEKLKQDSHHIKFRGQWKFMEFIRPFGDVLVKKGIAKDYQEIFSHDAEWLLDQFSEAEELSKLIKPEGFRMSEYQTYRLDRTSSEMDLKTIEGSLEEVNEELRGQGFVNAARNLKESFEQVWGTIVQRYPDQKSLLNKIRIRVIDGGNHKSEIVHNLLVLNYEELQNSYHVTQEILRCMDWVALNPETIQDKAIETILLDIEEAYAFLTLSIEEKINYLEFLLMSHRFAEKESFYRLIVQSINSEQEKAQIIKRLSGNEDINKDDLRKISGILEQKMTNETLFGLAFANLQESNLSSESKKRIRQLSDIFSDNLSFLMKLWENKYPNRGKHEFYQSLFEESRVSGISFLLSVIGGINVNCDDQDVDKLLLRRRWQVDFDSTPVDYVFIGGGGANSGTIGRSVKWINDHERQGSTVGNVHSSINIVSTWDRGGSSQKDADAVRKKYNTHVISPGDIMTVLAFQSITNDSWFIKEDTDSLWQSSFKPENLDAVMDLIYTYHNRLIIPEGQTFQSIIEKRIHEVYDNDSLNKPSNWHEFVISLRAAARVIDQEVINKGLLQEIKHARTSVQNLLLMALVIAFNKNSIRASQEIHYILGLRDIFAIPASFEDAVSGMRLQTLDGQRMQDEIVGHLNYANERDSYFKGSGLSQYRGKPLLINLKKSEDAISQDVLPEEFPSANPDALRAINNSRRAIIMGMSSPFDSTLVNLMPKGIVEAMKAKVKEGVYSIYFPKVISELQIEGLTLKEILEIFERSIQEAQGDPSFRIESIITHVFMPSVPNELWDIYLEQLKEVKKDLLNEEGKKELEKAMTIGQIRDILSEKRYWNEETNRKVKEGWIKISKMIPGDRFPFDEGDRQFLAERGIKIIDGVKENHDKLYRIWEGRVIYNTNEVVRIINSLVDDRDSRLSPVQQTTMLNPNSIDKIVKIGGSVLRGFLSDLSRYENNPQDSPYADLVSFNNLWEAVREYKKYGENVFTDDILCGETNGIPRIEIRGKQHDGEAAQVVIIGIPNIHRSRVVSAFRGLAEKEGLTVELGGTMSVEIKKTQVDKALPIDYIERHLDHILDVIGYTPGDLIDVRKTKTAIIADGDGTTFGKPTQNRNPNLNESSACEALSQYLSAGGLYIVNSGNDLRLTVSRLLENNAIPPELRNRIIICGNGGANMAYIDRQGQIIEIDEYRFQAVEERIEQSREKTVETLDAVYIGDDASENGNDFCAFRRMGFRRSIIVSNDDLANIPKELRINYLGRLEEGTRVFLEKVFERAKLTPFNKLFDMTGLKLILSEAELPLTSLGLNELNAIKNEFIEQANSAKNVKKSSLTMETAHISGSTGSELGEFIAVDWGGTNLRVMLVRLEPGKKPEIVKSIERPFTNAHKSGKDNPFGFVVQLIKELKLNPNENYELGFSFGQPIEQKGITSGIVHKWVKGWNIPQFIGKDAGELLQDAMNRAGINNIEVQALINDIVATHLSIPKATIGLVVGTGYGFTIIGENNEIVMTESGGFLSKDLPQTIYDRNIYQNMDPINSHASEKMVSGAYLGVLLRLYLQTLRDRGEFMSQYSYIFFLDEPQKLHKEEFNDEVAFCRLLDSIIEDARRKLQIGIPQFLSLEEKVNWVTEGSVLFSLFEYERLEDYLTEDERNLYSKIKAEYNVSSLSELSWQQVRRLTKSLDGQKLQRSILGLCYNNLMPSENPDISMTRLLSLIEGSGDLSKLRDMLKNDKCFSLLGAISNDDLQSLSQISQVISKRAGRLIAAQILAGIQLVDGNISRNHIVAVDGSVYKQHPRIAEYIDQGISELRTLLNYDRGGEITFQMVENASAIGAAIAAAIVSNPTREKSNDSNAEGVDTSENRMDDKGGIDFRVLPIVNQAMNIPIADVQLSGLNSFSQGSEWNEIQNMINAGIIPSCQRIKKYLRSCCQKKEPNGEIGKVLNCIASIMRIEEDQVLTTDPEFKNMLVLIESSKTVDELRGALDRIHLEPKEPELVTP